MFLGSGIGASGYEPDGDHPLPGPLQKDHAAEVVARAGDGGSGLLGGPENGLDDGNMVEHQALPVHYAPPGPGVHQHAKDVENHYHGDEANAGEKPGLAGQVGDAGHKPVRVADDEPQHEYGDQQRDQRQQPVQGFALQVPLHPPDPGQERRAPFGAAAVARGVHGWPRGGSDRGRAAHGARINGERMESGVAGPTAARPAAGRHYDGNPAFLQDTAHLTGQAIAPSPPARLTTNMPGRMNDGMMNGYARRAPAPSRQKRNIG